MGSNTETYKLALRDKNMYPTLAYGSAGTGKTYEAVCAAVEGLKSKSFQQIIVTRPNVSFADKNGFLPGTEREKMEPWVRPILQHMTRFATRTQIDLWEKSATLQFYPLEFIQGMTFDKSFIIVDECQNLDIKQLMVILQRTGKWSKLVLCGDIAQISPKFPNSGLKELIDMIDHFELPVHLINFTREDIVRSQICKMFVSAQEDWEIVKSLRRS